MNRLGCLLLFIVIAGPVTCLFGDAAGEATIAGMAAIFYGLAFIGGVAWLLETMGKAAKAVSDTAKKLGGDGQDPGGD